MNEDFIRERGYLTLGSRLKRLGERLQADVTRLAQAEGYELPAALFPTLALLDRHGALTVGALAGMLGTAQPGVTRSLVQLEAMGLVKSGRDNRDQRMRKLALTQKGSDLVARAQSGMWPRIEQAVAAICIGLEGPILRQLDAIEAALDHEPLDIRAAGRTTNG